MKFRFWLMSAVLLLFFFTYSFSQVPQLINYQGKLTKSSGAPLDTTIQMIFSIYADSNGSVSKWTETQGSVKVDKGVFNVLLGSVNLIPDTVFDGNIRYLGVKVGGDPEITPRKPMVSVPYAYHAESGGGTDNDWTIKGDTIYHLNGNVGIGTTSPGQKLSVIGLGESDPNNPVGSYRNNIDGAAILLNLENSQPAAVGSTNETVELRFGVAGGGWSNVAARIIAGKEQDYMSLVNSDGYLAFHTTTDAGTQPYEKMRITSAGNVGIGTTTPNEQLEITGNLRLPASTASVGVIKSGANRFIHNFGPNNFFAGVNAGNFTTSGYDNTGVGVSALQALTTGRDNTAVGYWALYSDTTGNSNTAVGQSALYYNTTGGVNTAVGPSALYHNATGNYNTAMGSLALYLNTTGTYNTAIGCLADVSAGGWTNATVIGYNAVVDASNKVRIGNISVTSIGGQVGWTTFSDGRYKKSISENVPGLDFISKLKPVTYTVDVDAIDAALKPARKPREGQTEDAFKLTAEEMASRQAQSQIVYTGFIAQEVEKAARETGYDFSGVDAPKNAEGMYGLRYAEFVVPLVKAVQEQQETIKAQQEQIKMLEQRVAELEKK